MQDDFRKIITKLIARYPGYTAQDYANIALGLGFFGSYSRDLLFSLQNTLTKEYREGRMPQIKIVKVDGKTRYFPSDDLKGAMSAYFRLDARRQANKLNE